MVQSGPDLAHLLGLTRWSAAFTLLAERYVVVDQTMPDQSIARDAHHE